MTDDHQLELATGGLKSLGSGTLEKVIEEIADVERVIHGVQKEPRTLPE
jgi:hypothetical protein